MNHFASQKFWREFERLHPDARRAARAAFRRLIEEPFHPSLRLKEIEPGLWSARVGLHYRALARRRGDNLYWYWIGPHSDYDGLIGGGE